MDDTRKLVYHNIACGCSDAQAADAFGLTLEQVDAMFTEVALKLAGHIVFSRHPYVACQTRLDAYTNRHTLIPMMEALDLDAGLIERVKSVRHRVTVQTK